MSVRFRHLVMDAMGGLRHEPATKRVRAVVGVDLGTDVRVTPDAALARGGRLLLDTTSAQLAWEPRRPIAEYAVPVAAVRAELRPAARSDGHPQAYEDRPVLDPTVPFTAHTTPGRVVDLVTEGGTLAGAGFLPDDPDLADHVLLDFAAVGGWFTEDERNVGHARDPFARIDVHPSSQPVRISRHGEVLADTTRAMRLFETGLPVRTYLPREDVRVELRPSATTTVCAYKGFAAYVSPVVGAGEVSDLGWTYGDPLPDALRVRDLVAFFDERVDVEVGGVPQERPVSPWSQSD